MRVLWCVATILVMAGFAQAADDPKPEDLKKQYADTLVQLQAAQDRKAELAGENEKLTARVAELEKQLAAANTEEDLMRQQIENFSNRTFFLRAHYAAWEQFITRNPLVRAEWELFLNQIAPIAPSIDLPFIDPEWPMSARG